MAATADGIDRFLAGCETKIERVPQRYSDDPRSEQMRQYQGRSNFTAWSGSSSGEAKGDMKPRNPLPIERAYLEAIH